MKSLNGKRTVLVVSAVLATLIVLAGCPAAGAGGGGGSTVTNVVFQSVVQIGGTSSTADSTDLTLTFDVDPTTLVASDITVTGATKGALTGSGTTRSLTLFNINVANEGTVSVAITSPAGYSISDSTQTAMVYRVTKANMTIGDEYRGGKIAYILQDGDPGYNASVPHGLIAAPADQSTGIDWISPWSTQVTWVSGGTGTALGTGSANTDNIIAQAVAAGNSTPPSYAAGLARAHDGGGYNDWYLPSQDELDKLYLNRAAVGGFADHYYWSSSDLDKLFVWAQHFGSRLQATDYKSVNFRVRAVRAF